MGRKVKQLRNYSTAQIKTIIASNSNNIIAIKLHAILQLSKGHSSRELSEFYGVSFKQICNWAERFDAEGIEGLHIKSGRGRRSIFTDEQKELLYNDFLKGPEEFGFNSGIWTGALFGEHIKKNYNIVCSQSSVYNLFHSLGFSFQRGRPFYPERDHKKREVARSDIKKL
jgi:transposase